MQLLQLVQDQVRLGIPLPWGIRDAHGKLLLAQGQVLTNQAQMEALLSGANVPLTVVDTIDQVMSDTLQRGGIETVEQLAESDVDDVTSIIDMSYDEAERLIASARRIMEVKRLRGMQASSGESAEATEEGAEGDTVVAASVDEESVTTVERPTTSTRASTRCTASARTRRRNRCFRTGPMVPRCSVILPHRHASGSEHVARP